MIVSISCTPNVQAYTPKSTVWCVRCSESLPLLAVGDHLLLCPGEREEQNGSTHEQREGD